MIKTRIAALAAAGLITLAAMTSCGNGEPDYSKLDMDIDKLAENISTAVEYDDYLYPLEDDVTESIFTGIDAEDCVSYGGTGATSETVAIFEAENEAQAEEFKVKLEEYRKSCAAAFEKYTAGELDKLNAAIIRTVGKYAIFSVSPDSDKINSVIDDFVAESMK